MGIYPETGLYHHQFYLLQPTEDEPNTFTNQTLNKPTTNDKVCVICNDVREKHHEAAENDITRTQVLDATTESKVNLNHGVNLMGLNNLTNNNDMQKKFNQRANINPAYIKALEKEFEDKDLCIICYANELSDDIKYQLPCGHSFCRPCIDTYLTSLITDSKVENIKCLQAGCKYKIPEVIIKTIVKRETYIKYIKFKKKLMTVENLKRGYIPCIFPDCEEWVSYSPDDDDHEVECDQGHKFCGKCKEKWHGGKKCKSVSYINMNMINIYLYCD